MAKAPKKRNSSKKTKDNNDLLSCLEFVSNAQMKKGFPYQTHCKILDGNISAFDGEILATCPFPLGIEAYPHTETFTKALKVNGTDFNMTKLSNGNLKIKSDVMQNTIRCFPDGDLFNTLDQSNLEMGLIEAKSSESLKKCFKSLASIVDESDDIISSTLLLQSFSAIASKERRLILEYWHGIDFGKRFVLPLRFVKAVNSIHKDITGYYYSNDCFILTFEGNFKLGTLLLEKKWPEYDTLNKILTNDHELWPVPPEFFNDIDKIGQFISIDKDKIKQELIFFKEGHMSSSQDLEHGTNIFAEYLEKNQVFNFKDLKAVKNICQTITYCGRGENMFISGENLRGIICKVIYD